MPVSPLPPGTPSDQQIETLLAAAGIVGLPNDLPAIIDLARYMLAQAARLSDKATVDAMAALPTSEQG